MKTEITIEGEFDPRTATFWAKFQTENGGAQERHTNSASLYQTPSKGEFFIVNTSGGGLSTRYDLVENRAEIEGFLKERCDFILRHYY